MSVITLLPILYTKLFIGCISAIAFIIFVFTFYQLCIQDASSLVNSTYRNLTIIAILAYTLTSSIDFIHLSIFGDNRGDLSVMIIMLCADIFYFLGNTCFYILILLRIAKPFELNKYIYYAIISFISIATIASGWFCVGIFAPKLIWLGTSIILSAADLLLNSLLLIIFICKMRMTVNNIDSESSKETQINVNLMTNVMIKHSVLFGMATIMNQTFIATVILKDSKILLLGTQQYFIRAIENMVNILALWLTLQINYNKYICMCKCCHLCVSKYCMKHASTLE
eukprot:277875_1